MRPSLKPVALIAVLAATAVAAAPAAAEARCGPRTAAALERRLPVSPYIPPGGSRIGQTLCFDFTRDGRRDIVFTGWEAMNHGAHYWAAFRRRGGGWQRAKFKRTCCRGYPRFGMGIGILRSGRTLIVRQPVYRSDDPACCPSGGEREGRWRWKWGRLLLMGVTRYPP